MALMRWGTRKPSTALLIGLLLILLPLLAVLQYRWLTEVSEGEEVQMEIHLRAAAEQFAGNFDREVTRAFLTFQPAPGEIRPETSNNLAAVAARSWRLWKTTAPHPELVQAVDLVQADTPQRIKLLRFDPQQARFVPIAWPPALAAWRDRLLAASTKTQPPPAMTDILLASNPAAIPAIPVLFLHLPLSMRRGGPPGRHWKEPSPPPGPYPQRVLLIELNLPWLQNSFLPQLAQHAFSAGGKTEYHLAILNSATPDHPVFVWGPKPQASAVASSPDLSIPMFRIRMADFVAVWARPDVPAGMKFEKQVAIYSRRLPGPPKAMHPLKAPREGNGHRLQLFFPAGNSPGLWTLQVRHRAGSLAAAVARIRRRNLSVSGGILVLLLASVVLLARLVQSTERLAEQQMEFVAGVSHELRTPLAVIGSAAANLADGVVAEAAQVRRYGALIANEGRRLNAMVEQILEFSALQYRRQPLQTQPVAIAPLLEEVVQSAQPALAEKGISLECSWDETLPEIDADPSALRRCVENLIGNAVKYAAEAGWIGLRIEQDTEELRITIEDRGPGIEARDVPHLFEPFYRGRMAFDRQIHGNGLGLSLVQRLMKAQGGSVTLRTQLGRGSAFTLHFPLPPGVSRPQPSVSSSTA